MAYVNASAKGKHGIFESSNMKATDCGNLYDVVLAKDVDNGVAVKLGDYTGNGLQERSATVAAAADKIAVIGTPANVKDAVTRGQAEPYNFFIPAGKLAKAYEVVEGDVFAVADYQFTDACAAQIKLGAYVKLDGNGMYVAQAAAPESVAFIGKIHSISTGTNFTVVRILCVKNA